MKAMLRTRCGCTRMVTVSQSPPAEIRVPLLLHVDLGSPPASKERPAFEERLFRLQTTQGVCALYLEAR
jgi:hypothetical protein